jgi:predicted RNase H-like nuclease (RuvC/YqgF family)
MGDDYMNIIMGIDPGANTGIAIYQAGKLAELQTVEPHQLVEVIETVMPGRVVFEDSRLISPTWKRGVSNAAQLKIARDVGQIDAWCRLIVATCARLGIPAHGISPKHKGAKLDARQFTALTGWTGRSNEHSRDAACVAWQFRGARA